MSDDIHVLVDFGVGQTVVAPYVDHTGHAQVRRFVPRRFYIGSMPYYPEPRLLIDAWDLDRAERRTFAAEGFIAGAKAEGVVA